MKKKDLIGALAEKIGETKKRAEEIFNAFEEVIVDEVVKGEEVPFYFGKFKKKHSEARKGRNPATGEEIDIPASDKIVFKVGKAGKNL